METFANFSETNFLTAASSLKIGLFGICLDVYWPQFPGLKERLNGYLNEVHKKLSVLHNSITEADTE